MSEITIQEGNELIAVFDGYKKIENKFWRNRAWITIIGLNYHKDWNRLMQVVLKISRLHSDMNCKKMDFYLLNMSICSTIDMVWDGVIEFIQWYNTQTSIK